MNKEELMNLSIISQYKDTAIRMLRHSYPGASKQELAKAIEMSIMKHRKNGEHYIANKYKNVKIDIGIIELAEYIITREPIITARGVMFKKKGSIRNPLGKMIQTFMEGRDAYKKEMFKYPKGSENFEKYNLLQLLAKVDANALVK